MPSLDGTFTRGVLDELYDIVEEETQDMWLRVSRRMTERTGLWINPEDIRLKFTSGAKK
jgi:hypothetical protein